MIRRCSRRCRRRRMSGQSRAAAVVYVLGTATPIPDSVFVVR